MVGGVSSGAGKNQRCLRDKHEESGNKLKCNKYLESIARQRANKKLTGNAAVTTLQLGEKVQKFFSAEYLYSATKSLQR